MSVDERIVSMQFNNATFEKKMTETIKSLDKLRASLDFASSKRSLDDLSASGKNFSMEPMGHAVDGISNRFLAMASIGITALSNLTNRAVDSAVRIVKAFTFSPTIDGFREYETQLNSVQTILANTASKGTTLDQVNAALQKLNEYSDKTIYNFGQMAKNIGTFTAAGVDLDTSVGAIKGIANLAAVSGSNAEQASSAMYQLSQALATGTLKLIDWNSIVNAGMGGEVFKNALFETGKAMKTLTGVPVGQTLKEWEKANGSFRESLEEGWVTSDVLTTTLATFTGDLSDAQLKAAGFTQAQITNIQKMAKTAVGAATEVKTFTQLMGTVKEAVGTGWADSFKIIIGNFEEAKALWTGVNNAIGGFVGHMSESRNQLLQGWKDLGGRTALLNGIKEVFENLFRVIKPIGEAFRDIFPPLTVQRLLEMTQGFVRFAESLKIGAETAGNIRVIFRGLFAIFDIGWEIFKGIASVIGDVAKALAPAGNGIFDFTAQVGNMVFRLHQVLVEGGKIRDFFDRLGVIVVKPIKFIQELAENIREFFSAGISSDAVAAGFERIDSRVDHLTGVWDRFMDRMQGVFAFLDYIWEGISDWFSSLGTKIANAFKPGDFDAAVDIVNVGLLGGIALLLKRFVKNGFKLDFGTGIIDKLRRTFDELTNTLKAMQTNLKANTLLKIAAAMGILTASLVVLSLIDSAALTKALVAMAVGFGQIMAVMIALDKGIGGIGGAAKLTVVSSAMIGIAGAMVILAGAIKILSTMDPGDLAGGLIGMGTALSLLVGATLLISTNPAGLISATAAIIGMSGALVAIAGVVKIFGAMSVEDLAKGLGSVAISLASLVGATLLMSSNPAGLIAGTTAIIGLSGALLIISGVVKVFSMMSIENLAKGLGAMATSLGILVGVTYLMTTNPAGLLSGAAAMVIMASALNIMATAVLLMGQAGVDTLAKGLGSFAVMLTILVTAMNLMQGTIAGAAALLIVSGAMLILANVLEKLGKLTIAEIATGLGALAAALLILGLAAQLLQPVVPALLGIGAALTLIGIGVAAFGVAAMLVAKAFETIAKSGAKGAKAIVEIIKVFVTARYQIVKAIAEAIIGLLQELLGAVPLLVRLIEAALLQLIETVIKLAPNIAIAIGIIITEAILLIEEFFPQLIALGYKMLITFLKGIRDNVAEIVSLGIEIITGFIGGLISGMPQLVTSAVGLIVAFILELSNHVDEIIAAGFKLLTDFLFGIANNIGKVVETVVIIVVEFIKALSDQSLKIMSAGLDFILDFLQGITDNIQKVIDKGKDIVLKLMKGMADSTIDFVDTASTILTNFLNGMAKAIRKHSKELREAGINLAAAIADGLSFGLASKAGGVFGAIGKVVGGVVQKGREVAGVESPSTVFFEIGEYMIQGLINAFKQDTSAEKTVGGFGEKVINKIQESLNLIPNTLEGFDEFNPVITPVLDLTKVKAASGNIGSMMKITDIKPNYSFDKANLIASTDELVRIVDDNPVESLPTEIKFEQNNYSPKALSTNDIYRNTKSQIAIAREKLGIS